MPAELRALAVPVGGSPRLGSLDEDISAVMPRTFLTAEWRWLAMLN
jgi:hypothetical protein